MLLEREGEKEREREIQPRGGKRLKIGGKEERKKKGKKRKKNEGTGIRGQRACTRGGGEGKVSEGGGGEVVIIAQTAS